MTHSLSRIKSPRHAALLLSLLAAALGAGALAGWALNIGALKNIFASLVTMKVNTAIGMLLCGSALALLSQETVGRWIRLGTTVMAAAVMALGALTLAEYLFIWNPGIDQWLFRDAAGTVETLSPGRMGAPTAFCFVLAGIALLAMSQPVSTRLRVPILSALGTVILIIGGLALTAEFAHVLLGWSSWDYAGMSFFPAMGFVLLGSALLAVVATEGSLTWSVDTLTTCGFAIGIVALLAAAAGSYQFTRQLQVGAAWVSHTQEVLKEIKNFRGDMVDLESQQRGYIITGDEGLLKRREQFKAESLEDFELLRKLTADNPDQQMRLNQLDPLITQRMDFGDQTIAARRQQGFPAAQRLIATGTGIALSDKLYRLAEGMADEENVLLERRQNHTNAISSETFLILPLGVLLSLTVLFVGLFILNTGIRERRQTQTALALNEDRYRTLFEYAPYGILIADPQSYYLNANTAICRMLGYTRDELIGLHASDIVAPAETPHIEPALSAIKAGPDYQREWLLRRKDGSTFAAEVMATTMPDGNLLAMVRDITERKQAEVALQKSEARLSFALETINTGAWELDLRDHTAHRTLTHDRIFGYETLLPSWTFEMFLEHVLPEDRPGVERSFHRAIAAQGSWTFECRIRRTDGEQRWIWAAGGHERSAQGVPERMTGIVQDITERKKIEETRSRLAAIVESSDDAIIGKDLNSIVTSWNEGATKLFGYSAGEMVGQSILRLIPPDRQQEEEQILNRIKRAEVVEHMETVRKKKDGQLIDVSVTVSPIKDAAGKVVGASKIARDITERKRAGEALRESEATSRALLESSGQSIVAADRQGKILFANATAEKSFGYAPGKLLGQSVDSLIPASLRDRHVIHRAGFFAQPYALPMGKGLDLMGRRKDGTEFPVEIALNTIETRSGTLAVAFVTDITERKRAEDKVQEQAALLDLARDAIFVRDLESRIIFWNRGAEATYGWSEQEVAGRVTHELFQAKFPMPLEEIIAELHSRGQWEGELRHVTRDGRVIIVASRWSLQRNEAGEPKAILEINRDITASKKAEEAVAASEIRYRRLFEASEDGILILDAVTGKIVDSNPFLERLLGVTHEKLLGQTLWDIGLFDDIERSKAAFRELQAKGQVRYENLPLEGSDGRHRQVEFISNTYQVDQQEVIQCNVRDITERFQAEGLLREKAVMQEHLSNIIATVPGAVFSLQIRPDGTAFFPFASSRFQDIFSLPPEDLKRDAAVAFATVHADDLARLQAAIAASSQRLTPLHEEFRVQHPQRGTIWAEINSLPMRQPDGSVLWHGFSTDVTERKALESQLRQSQKMEAVGQLTGGVAHDFNNLLGVILGNLDLLERLVADNEAASKRVRTAQSAAERGADLTKRLLAFSSRQHLNPAPTWLNASIQNMIEMASRVLGPDIKISTSFDKLLPPVVVDSAGLENALLNLAVNARDAMPKGGSLTISTGLSVLDESYPPVQSGEIKPGRYARVTVSDNGQGMSRETLQRVFEPFFTTKARGKGTGLGLAMVYGFVKQSGGIARIYSELGQGTSVALYLPLAEGVPLPAQAVPERNSHARTGGTVLVVDDEVDLLEVAAAFAQEMGYRVLQATDGAGALAVVAREPGIELLVTDVIMPGGMNGVELAKKVRQLIPGIKVIYSSGFPSDALAERSGTKVDGPLLAKPYQRKEFAATLRAEMESSKAAGAGDHAVET